MKKIILIIVFILFIVGCNQGKGPSTSITDDEIYKGKVGLTFNFKDGMPPLVVHENDVFPVSFELKNEGAFDIKNGNLLLNIEKDYLEIESGNEREDLEIYGRSRENPEAGIDVMNFFIKSKKLGTEMETITSNILATTCYEYRTYFSENICIDTDYYEIKNIAKSCDAEDLSFGSGQGSPITITKVESRMLEDNDKIKPMFVIYIRNQGLGEVISSDSVDDICSSKTVDYDAINNIEIEAYLSGSLLECKPENPRLKDKEEIVRCTLEEGIGKDVQPYTTLLTVIIDYGYTETISKKIKIRKEN